jgi:DNA-binding transcriptional LysR family regulator
MAFHSVRLLGATAVLKNATFRQLQIFVAAAERLSFARVADELHLTPAAVSFQIRQLEMTAGCPLFERVGRRVRLSEAGRLLRGYAELALSAMNDAGEAFAALRDPDQGEVALGLISTAKYIAPHIVARFRELNRGAHVRLIDGNRREILSSLDHGTIDLAIMGRPPETFHGEAVPFADHPYVIVAPMGHPLAGRADLRLADLAGEDFILREEGSGSRQLVEELFAAAGISPSIVMTTSSNETIKQAVMAGIGLAGLSRHTAILELGLGMMTALDVHGSPWMRTWFVAHRRSMPLLPLHARLKAFILAEGRGVVDAMEAAQTEWPTRSPKAPTPRAPLAVRR